MYIFKGSVGTRRSEIRRCFPANYRQIRCKSATPSPTRFRERKQHPRVSPRSRNASHAGKYIITHSLPCDTFCSGYKSANTLPCRRILFCNAHSPRPVFSSTYFSPPFTSTIPYETSLKEFRPHHACPSHVLLIILEPVDEWAYSGKKIPRRNGVATRAKKHGTTGDDGETSGEELEFLGRIKIHSRLFRFIFRVSRIRIEYRRVLIFLLKIFGIEFFVHDEILIKSWFQSIIIDTKWTRIDWKMSESLILIFFIPESEDKDGWLLRVRCVTRRKYSKKKLNRF